jgi:hypothetical protein
MFSTEQNWFYLVREYVEHDHQERPHQGWEIGASAVNLCLQMVNSAGARGSAGCLSTTTVRQPDNLIVATPFPNVTSHTCLKNGPYLTCLAVWPM